MTFFCHYSLQHRSRKFKIIYIYIFIIIFIKDSMTKYLLSQCSLKSSRKYLCLFGTDKEGRFPQGVCPATYISFLSSKQGLGFYLRILKEGQIWRGSKVCNREKKGKASLWKFNSSHFYIANLPLKPLQIKAWNFSQPCWYVHYALFFWMLRVNQSGKSHCLKNKCSTQ